MNFRTERTKPLAQLTAYDVPRGLDPDDVATDEVQSADNHDECIVCGKVIPPGPDFCSEGCEKRAGASTEGRDSMSIRTCGHREPLLNSDCIQCAREIPDDQSALSGVERTPPTQEELQQRVRDLERTFELLSTERDEWRELSARWETAAWAADNKLRELEQRQAGSVPQPDALPRRYSLGGTEWFTVENESLNFYTGDGRFSHRISADRYHIAIASLAPEAPQVEAGRMSGSADSQGWLYEDELPEGYPYDAMWPYSKVDGVRLFPRLPERQEGIVHEKSSNNIFMRDLVHYLCTGEASSTLKEAIANFVASSSSYPQLFGPAESDHKPIRSVAGHRRS